MSLYRFASLILPLTLLVQPAGAERRVEKSADGSRRAVYSVDAQGRRHGWYREYEHGKPAKEQFWIDGRLILPKSSRMIDQQLQAIARMPVKTVGAIPPAHAEVVAAVRDPVAQAAREQALRQLAAYRYLCDLPYADLQLDQGYVAHAVAAARIMNRLDKLTHDPENPGWPAADYQFALEGTRSSNISTAASLPKALRMFMGDSDPGNIDRLGHRRWCLNPSMQRTGFGVFGEYSAMWSFDRSRQQVPDYDFVAFPPRGLMPAAMFAADWAWSVSLDPKKYQPADKATTRVEVVPVQFNATSNKFHERSPALKPDYFGVDTQWFGIPNCVIFRPAGVAVVPRAAYRVRLTGLRDPAGRETKVEYMVGFY